MKKIACLVLAVIMILSLMACGKLDSGTEPTSSGLTTTESMTDNSSRDKDTNSKNENSSKTNSSSKGTSIPQNETSSKKENTSSKSNNSSYVAPWETYVSSQTEDNHKHEYSKTVKLASCGKGGYEKYTCECGDSYKENVVGPTYKHDFEYGYRQVNNRDEFPTFICKICGLDAIDVDGNWLDRVKKDEVRWYVLGDMIVDEKGYYYENNYELVICGKGAIKDYSTVSSETTSVAPWRNFLKNKLKSITIADGITSIGKNAFNYTVKEQKVVDFKVAGSVKTIKSGAINLNIYAITLESGIEKLESGAISGVRDIYLPKSVKYCGSLGNKTDQRYYYEGGIDELLKIKTEYIISEDNKPKTIVCNLKERCEYAISHYLQGTWHLTIILHSPKIRRGDSIFNGKKVLTDSNSLSLYVK